MTGLHKGKEREDVDEREKLNKVFYMWACMFITE